MTGGFMVAVAEGAMLFERAFPCQMEWRARLAAASGGRQGVHPLHVPGHRDEAPLTLDLVKATQEELTEAHHRFDDAEHRFRNLLAQGVELLAFGRLQTMAHGRERRRVLRRRRCFGKALRQGRMMRLAAQRNHRIDLCRSAQRHIGVAEVTVVRQQCLRLSQIGRQCLDPLQHRLDLLLVVGGLNHDRGAHQKAVGCHHRLSVVALLEPVAGHRHDARLFVGQIDLTDEESRIMPVAGGGFEQCYNAQAVVAAGSLLVVAAQVVQAPNDKQQIEPMLKRIEALPADLGKPETLLADNGYFSDANVALCAAAQIDPMIALGRQSHHPSLAERFAKAPPAPENPTPLAAMSHRLQTPEGKKLYALRKQIPEPVFGIIKSVMGFRQFLLRGLDQVQGEWSLVTMAWNMKRMYALAAA